MAPEAASMAGDSIHAWTSNGAELASAMAFFFRSTGPANKGDHRWPNFQFMLKKANGLAGISIVVNKLQ
jgi:hypothetical protein